MILGMLLSGVSAGSLETKLGLRTLGALDDGVLLTMDNSVLIFRARRQRSEKQ